MEEKSLSKADDRRMLEWEVGLPSPEDLMPLSQSLITPELALAFGITAEPCRGALDLNCASHDTYSTICRREGSFEPLKLFPDKIESDGFCNNNKIRKIDCGVAIGGGDEANSGLKEEGFNGGGGGGDENGSNRAVKRPRLVWTPQLHKRFVDVIEHLGIDKAVPKTIMEMMNVEGLTRENVASHLQKYRLYLKRVEGSSGDHQENSTPPRRVANINVYDSSSNGCGQMQHSSAPFMPIPMVGAAAATAASSYGYGHLGMHVGGAPPTGYCGLESGAYNMFWNRQRG